MTSPSLLTQSLLPLVELPTGKVKLEEQVKVEMTPMDRTLEVEDKDEGINRLTVLVLPMHSPTSMAMMRLPSPSLTTQRLPLAGEVDSLPWAEVDEEAEEELLVEGVALLAAEEVL